MCLICRVGGVGVGAGPSPVNVPPPESRRQVRSRERERSHRTTLRPIAAGGRNGMSVPMSGGAEVLHIRPGGRPVENYPQVVSPRPATVACGRDERRVLRVRRRGSRNCRNGGASSCPSLGSAALLRRGGPVLEDWWRAHAWPRNTHRVGDSTPSDRAVRRALSAPSFLERTQA